MSGAISPFTCAKGFGKADGAKKGEVSRITRILFAKLIVSLPFVNQSAKRGGHFHAQMLREPTQEGERVGSHIIGTVHFPEGGND